MQPKFEVVTDALLTRPLSRHQPRNSFAPELDTSGAASSCLTYGRASQEVYSIDHLVRLAFFPSGQTTRAAVQIKEK